MNFDSPFVPLCLSILCVKEFLLFYPGHLLFHHFSLRSRRHGCQYMFLNHAGLLLSTLGILEMCGLWAKSYSISDLYIQWDLGI